MLTLTSCRQAVKYINGYPQQFQNKQSFEMFPLLGPCKQAKSEGNLWKTLQNLVTSREIAWKMKETLETLLVSWTFYWVDWELFNTGLTVVEREKLLENL